MIVPGDVNSTLAAALVAAKLGIPIAHLEAGLRSFDRSMPEEINRIVADEFSDLLLAHSDEALANLGREGIDTARVHLVGNTMIDSARRLREPLPLDARGRLDGARTGLVRARDPAQACARRRPAAGFRDGRAPDGSPNGRRSSFRCIHAHAPASTSVPIGARLTLLDPLGYLEFLSLEADAGAVLTDSGGVQEETSYLGVPCFTLRSSTERPVTVRLGTNTMLGLDPAAIRQVALPDAPVERPQIATWDGKAAERVATVVADFLDSHS